MDASVSHPNETSLFSAMRHAGVRSLKEKMEAPRLLAHCHHALALVNAILAAAHRTFGLH
jgi:hypothetical protein